MSDVLPSFETKDLQGTTGHFNGTVGTSAIDVPAVAGNPISEVLIKNPTSNTPITKVLKVSFDGGVTYLSLSVGEFIIWPVKGELTQFKIQGSVAGVEYEILLNREPV